MFSVDKGNIGGEMLTSRYLVWDSIGTQNEMVCYRGRRSGCTLNILKEYWTLY